MRAFSRKDAVAVDCRSWLKRIDRASECLAFSEGHVRRCILFFFKAPSPPPFWNQVLRSFCDHQLQNTDSESDPLLESGQVTVTSIANGQSK
jgi:hypothetical protein